MSRIIQFICGFVFATLPMTLLAQDSELSVQVGDVSSRGDGEASVLSVIMLVLISISVPMVISFIIRKFTGSTLASYFGTYLMVIIAYGAISMVMDVNMAGSITTVGLLLLVPSMIGALLGQTVYYLRLPKPVK